MEIHGRCGRVERIRRREEEKTRLQTASRRRFSCGLRRAVDGVGGGLGRTQHHQADGLGGWVGVGGSSLLAGGQRRAGFGAEVDQTLVGLEAG